jgi:hypothetical protein
MSINKSRFPKGWGEDRLRRVLAHYEEQTEAEAVADDEAAFEDKTQTLMEVPNRLVPAIRELIAKQQAEPGRTGRSGRRPKAGRA